MSRITYYVPPIVLWPAVAMALGCAVLGVALAVERGSVKELRAPETWAVAFYLAIVGLTVRLIHPPLVP